MMPAAYAKVASVRYLHTACPAGGCGRPAGHYSSVFTGPITWSQAEGAAGSVSAWGLAAVPVACVLQGDRIVSELRIRSFRPGQVTQWLACGWRLWRRRPLEVMLPAAVFALAVLMLRAIPGLGAITLLLLLPSGLASHILPPPDCRWFLPWPLRVQL